ncbi:MAG: malate dehydrogenase, partial [Solirubrobacteraceae bacterium]
PGDWRARLLRVRSRPRGGVIRVVIAGAGGGVGASLAFNLLVSELECEVVMLDARANMVRSHLWDLEQVLEQGATGSIREGALDDVTRADLLVLAAAAPLTVNTSRMVYLADNVALLAPLLDGLGEGWPGTVIMVTNPVDPLCTWAQRRTGIDRRRLLGYTLNDSLRLRTGIGRALGAPPARVDAWAIGEHGDLAVPLWDRVQLDGRPASLSDEQREQVREFVDGWYVRHVALDSGRSSTWTSGLGVARMVRACVRSDGAELWPASIMLDGEYGIEGISLSVPVTLRGGGAAEIHEWALSDGEAESMRAAARFVREAAAGLR